MLDIVQHITLYLATFSTYLDIKRQYMEKDVHLLRFFLNFPPQLILREVRWKVESPLSTYKYVAQICELIRWRC